MDPALLTAFALLLTVIHKISAALTALEPHGLGLSYTCVLGAVAPNLKQLRHTANRIYNRMQTLQVTETELSERCSVAAIHMFDSDPPFLTRDRIAKILMNRRDVPAKSAARVISEAELIVLARVLEVPAE